MSKIKILVMDVDGTLTDGKIYMGSNGEIMKAFNVKDGYGIAQILPKYDIIPMMITGRKSEITLNRANELNITHIYQGVTDKLTTLKDIAEKLSISSDEIAYIGDDLNDIECIDYAGLTACPNDAVGAITRYVDYICPSNAGDGAVRDFIDYISDLL